MIEGFLSLFIASQQLYLVDNDVFKMLTSALMFHHICISHNFLTSCTSDLLNNSPSPLWWGKKKDGGAYLFSGLQWVELTKMMWHNLSSAITNQWALHMLGHIPSGFTFLKVQQVLQCVIKGSFHCQAGNMRDMWRLQHTLLSQTQMRQGINRHFWEAMSGFKLKYLNLCHI